MNAIIKAELTLFAVAFIWGVNPPIMKLGLECLPPILYNTVRMAFAGICAILAVWLTGQYRPMNKQDMLEMLKLSVFGFLVFQLFFTWGVQRTTAGNASLILGLLPVGVVIIHRICGIEVITRQMAAGIVLSFAGIVLIVIGSGKEMSLASDHLIGGLFLIIAQIGYAYFMIFSKPLTVKYPHYQTTAFALIVNTIIFFLISLSDIVSTDWLALPLQGWISTFFSGVFAIAAGNFLWIWGVTVIGSTKAAMFNNIAPIIAIVFGYILLGENFGLIQGLGAVIAFGGLYLTRTKTRIFGQG